jgi:hypothetical protein
MPYRVSTSADSKRAKQFLSMDNNWLLICIVYQLVPTVFSAGDLSGEPSIPSDVVAYDYVVTSLETLGRF